MYINKIFNKFFYVGLLVALVVDDVTTRKKFKAIHFENTTTNYTTDYIGNYSIQISKDQNSIDIDLDFIKDLPRDVWLQVAISQKFLNTGRYRAIFTYNVNVCSILGQKEINSLNIINTWMNNLMKFTDMPKYCPIKAGNYNWRNLRPEKDSIPAFVLSGVYRLDARFYLQDTNNASLTNTSIWVQVKMK